MCRRGCLSSPDVQLVEGWQTAAIRRSDEREVLPQSAPDSVAVGESHGLSDATSPRVLSRGNHRGDGRDAASEQNPGCVPGLPGFGVMGGLLGGRRARRCGLGRHDHHPETSRSYGPFGSRCADQWNRWQIGEPLPCVGTPHLTVGPQRANRILDAIDSILRGPLSGCWCVREPRLGQGQLTFGSAAGHQNEEDDRRADQTDSPGQNEFS